MINLTGKALELFKEWFHNTSVNHFESVEIGFRYDFQPYDVFIRLSPSMQWGVIKDFADSLGIHVSIEFLEKPKPRYRYRLVMIGDPTGKYNIKPIYDSQESYYKTESRAKAVAAINVIINTSQHESD